MSAPDEEYSFPAEFQAVFIPKQKPAPDPVPDDMKVVIATFPPLGQVTDIKSGDEISFTALLDVPESRSMEAWNVALWHSTDDREWIETPFQPAEVTRQPVCLQDQPVNTVRFYYAATISMQNSVQFTVKFRGENENWRWIRDEQSLTDGTVLVQASPARVEEESEKLEGIILGLDPTWKVKSLMSQAPGTSLWSLETDIGPVNGDYSTFADIPVGVPWGKFLRWFALVRIWAPWLAPRHGKDSFQLDKDAILCSFLSPQGRHLVFLALSGVNDVLSVFRHTPDGAVSVHARNDGAEAEAITVLVATGNNFESANAAVMYQARNFVTVAKQSTDEFHEELLALRDGVKPEWMENWYDGLGFCTWNALGQRLTEQKVFDAVDQLAKSGIKITSLIIDDNWQNIDYRGDGQFQHGWNDFEAEPNAFPNGLKATVSHIRKKHPHIHHIAVWHALLGYWAGISPDGKLASSYKTTQVVREDIIRRNLPLGGKMTVIAEPDVHRFYDDFYRFLQSSGIDAVKTDAQFMIDTWVGAEARRTLIKTYLDAWTISSLRHFSIKAISCMSQTPQILFYSQLPRNRPAVLCRNSDDFFPEIPSSHPWHVWTNAHNSLLTQHLNVLPDWDMFQTVHDYSGFHAAARCISGGPVYITDVPGKHNMELIGQMTGMTTRGKTVIFRPSVLGKTVDAYTGYDDDALLKVGSYHGAAVTGTPLLAVFNISARPLTEIIPLSRFPGVLSSLSYVVRSHVTGRILPPVDITDPKAAVVLTLEVRGYDIFTAYPLTAFESERSGRVFVANLGLVGKMTGAAAIVSNSIGLRMNGRIFLDTKLKALGVLGIYISDLDALTIEADFLVTIQGQAIPRSAVTISAADPHVLEIDVERSWNEMDLKPGWSNEVEVKTYFGMD